MTISISHRQPARRPYAIQQRRGRIGRRNPSRTFRQIRNGGQLQQSQLNGGWRSGRWHAGSLSLDPPPCPSPPCWSWSRSRPARPPGHGRGRAPARAGRAGPAAGERGHDALGPAAAGSPGSAQTRPCWAPRQARGQAYAALGDQVAALGSGLAVSAYAAGRGQPLWTAVPQRFSGRVGDRAASGCGRVSVARPGVRRRRRPEQPAREEVVLAAATGRRIRAYPAAPSSGARWPRTPPPP